MTRRLTSHPARGVGLMLLVAAALVPFVSSDTYWQTVLATGLLYGVLAMSLDLLWGQAGVLNLAPAMAFGIGAYTWGVVTKDLDGLTGTYVAIVAGLVLPAMVGAFVAFVSFKAGAREIYFALITLALTLALEQLAQVSTGLTGGSNGLITATPPELGIPAFTKEFVTPTDFYWLALGVTAIAFVFCTWLVASRFGTILRAIRESDLRAESLGYSTLTHRVTVSAISAALAGLAGLAYAPLTGIVDPSVFGVALSVQVFVWVAVGGAGTLAGPLVAAIAIYAGQASLTGSSATAFLLVIGAVFVVIVLVLPGGLASVGAWVGRALAGATGGLRTTPAPAAAPDIPKESST